MKLAEALILRADLRKRLEQLKERIKLSALVQDGEQPPEEPRLLIDEARRVLAEMTGLVRRINHTNLTVGLPDGRSLTDALAERDELALCYNLLQSTAEAATPKVDRMGRAEIRKIPTVKVSEIRREMDEVAGRRRELDVQIQAVNWTAELLDWRIGKQVAGGARAGHRRRLPKS